MQKPLAVLAVLVFFPCTARAQDVVRVEGSPALVLPTEDFAGADLGTGAGIGINVSVRLLPHLAPYVGWDWRHLEAKALFGGPDVDLGETGYRFGIRFEHPIAGTRTAWMARAGGTYAHLELEDENGDLVFDSGHGIGWEVGTGLAFALGDRWHLTPEFGFRSLEREVEVEFIRSSATLRYVTLVVGVSRSF
jgi:hypothetical protein